MEPAQVKHDRKKCTLDVIRRPPKIRPQPTPKLAWLALTKGVVARTTRAHQLGGSSRLRPEKHTLRLNRRLLRAFLRRGDEVRLRAADCPNEPHRANVRYQPAKTTPRQRRRKRGNAGKGTVSDAAARTAGDGGARTWGPPWPFSQRWYLRMVRPRFSATTRSSSLSDARRARAAIWVYLLYL